MVVQLLAQSPHGKKVLNSIIGSECFGVEFVYSLHGFSSGTPASSHWPKTCKLGVRLVGLPKSPLGVNVRVDGVVVT